MKAHYEFDWPGAEREYLRALDLNPNDAYAHVFYSNSYLSPHGRHAEAIDEMQKANRDRSILRARRIFPGPNLHLVPGIR